MGGLQLEEVECHFLLLSSFSNTTSIAIALVQRLFLAIQLDNIFLQCFKERSGFMAAERFFLVVGMLNSVLMVKRTARKTVPCVPVRPV